MKNNEFNTIIEPSQGIFKEKGSRFIAFSIPVSTEEEIKSTLETMRKKYHDARHICYAYILGEDEKIEHANDDGEPTGTAGKQILKQLQIKELTNILVVVVRYFGGVLLGTGPLSQAYREATNCSLENNKMIKREIQLKCNITFQYEEMNTVMVALKKLQATVISQKIDMECSIIAQFPKRNEEMLFSQFKSIESINIQMIES
jgi:uncharacterized YigZ family protein